MKVGEFDAGDAGNIDQGGKCDGGRRKEGTRGVVGKLVEDVRCEMGLLFKGRSSLVRWG